MARFFETGITWAFLSFAFFSPISIAGAQISIGIALVCFIGMLFTGLRFPYVKEFKPIYVSIIIFMFWMVLTALLGYTPSYSLFLIKEEWLFCIIPMGIFIFSDKKRAQKIILTYAVGLLLASLYGMTQHITAYDILRDQNLHNLDTNSIRLSGFFSHPLTFGNYTAVSSLFLGGYTMFNYKNYTGWKRWLLIGASLSAVAACSLCNSRGPLLSLGIGLVLVGFVLKKIRYAFIAFVLAILFGMTVTPSLLERFQERFRVDTQLRFEGGRFFVWYHSWLVVKDHPFFGTGQGNFQKEYTSHLREDIGEHRKYTHAHNDMLNFAAVAGFPGMFFYLLIWFFVLKQLYREYRKRSDSGHDKAIIIAVLLGSLTFFSTSMTEATFADEEVRQFLMFLWSAGLAVVYNPMKRNKEIVNSESS